MQSKIDALIGSGLDPGEEINFEEPEPQPEIYISTKGKSGGTIFQNIKYKSINPSSRDRHLWMWRQLRSCHYSSLSEINLEQAINIGAYCGAECSTHHGPY